MRYCVGIDLGSTTTKAVVLDERAAVLGRGITNSRSNYGVACDVAMGAALEDARFALIGAQLERLLLRPDRQLRVEPLPKTSDCRSTGTSPCQSYCFQSRRFRDARLYTERTDGRSAQDH